MTGAVYSIAQKSGKEYLYIMLRYKDPRTGCWKNKSVSTGIEAAGNKRKAKKMPASIRSG